MGFVPCLKVDELYDRKIEPTHRNRPGYSNNRGLVKISTYLNNIGTAMLINLIAFGAQAAIGFPTIDAQNPDPVALQAALMGSMMMQITQIGVTLMGIANIVMCIYLMMDIFDTS